MPTAAAPANVLTPLPPSVPGVVPGDPLPPPTLTDLAVLRAAHRFGAPGHERVLVEGTLVTTAAAGTVVPVHFIRAGDGVTLGSTKVTATASGSATFRAVLDADAGVVFARVRDGATSNAVGVGVGADVDGDGVPDSVEALASGGDGNRDGVPDATQAGVATLPAAPGQALATLHASAGTLHSVTSLPASSAGASRAQLPYGLYGFELRDLTPGASATVRLTLPSGARPTDYFKLDPVTGALGRFTFDGTTGAEFDRNVVTLHLTDGGRGDADGVANGVIVDPGGPGGPAPLVQTFYVPFPEDQLLSSLDAVNTASESPIQTYVSITAVADGTVLVYDHWEDGYEPDLADPVQSTTQLWGDGVLTNGIAPDDPDDLLDAGQVIILNNTVNTSSLSTIDYDGRDKFGVTKTVAVTRMAWPTLPSNNGPLLAEGIEVYDVGNWGTAFRAPVGVNLPTADDNDMFEYSGLMVMASQANTTVQIDADNNGIFETSTVLNEGQSYLVNGNVQRGAQVVSDKPVQVALLTGDIGSTYASRWFTMLPTDTWSNVYYTPVATTTTAHETAVFVYNPGASAITIGWDTSGGAQTSFSVGAGATVRRTIPTNTAAKFYSTGSEPFYAVTAVDAEPSGNGWGYDWGMTLLPADRLTHQVLVGLGFGSSPVSASTNYNPVWVTPVGNGSTPVNVYVDYDGDNAGLLTDPNGFHYDQLLSLTELQSARIYEPDGDQTGLLVYVIDPNVKLAAAWGENPLTSSGGETPGALPAIDAGTGTPPLPEFEAGKIASLVTDVNGDGEVGPGDTLRYDIVVRDISRVPVPDILLTDDVPAHTTYVAGSTTQFSSQTGLTTPIADDGSGTAFPLDAAGKILGQLVPGEEFVVSFEVVIDSAAVLPDNVESIFNTAHVTAYGQTEDPTVETILYGAVHGLVFDDRDRSGQRETTEPGLANVQVTITDKFGQTHTVTTGADGRYTATIPAGSATVDVVNATLPLGIEVQTAGIDPSPVYVIAGEDNDAGIDGFDIAIHSLSGVVYNDVDNDGVRDAGEAGLANVVVTLTGTNYLGVAVNRTAVSDLAGAYRFDDMVAGAYTVTETHPTGWTDGLDTVGAPALGATAGNDTIGTFTFPRNADVNTANNNFGELGVSLGGRVFVDANWNGKQDGAEFGLAGVTVTLKDAAGTTLATQTTAFDGSYTFGARAPGLYTVVETQPANYGSSTPDTVSINLAVAGQHVVNFGDTPCGVENWVTGENGGTENGKGTVTEDTGMLLREGDSFLVWAEKEFVVSDHPGLLRVKYTDLFFDTDSTGRIKDAFEIALVDPADGRSVIATYLPGRQSAFNVTEGLPVMTGQGTTEDGGVVLFDLTNLAPGRTVKLIVRLVNNDADTDTQVRIHCVHLTDAAPPKFFVVDDGVDTTFRYNPEGGPLGTSALLGANGGPASPRGIASNATGSRQWVVDAQKTVWIYDGYGTPVGSWQATDSTITNAQGITTNGTDIWLIDAGSKKVYRYAGAASWTGGTAAATSSFALHADNTRASDLVTDGTTVWVTDEGTDEVFVYSTAGVLQGRWTLDSRNTNASGITISPAGGNDIWVVDRQDLVVYHYANGRTQTSGSVTATGTFALSAGQSRPEGIADPPPGTLIASDSVVLTGIGTVEVTMGVYGNDPMAPGIYHWEYTVENISFPEPGVGLFGLGNEAWQSTTNQGSSLDWGTYLGEGYGGTQISWFSGEFTSLLPSGSGTFSFDTPESQITDVIVIAADSGVATEVSGFILGPGTVAPPPQATIGNRVWNDLDQDGIQDLGEPGLSGVMVYLYDEFNFVDMTSTDANGNYSFSAPGGENYQVQFALLSGYEFTTQNAGGDDTTDSDADQPNGMTDFYFVASGATNNTIDAGMFQPAQATIGNRVWNDLDQDGIQDAGEPGLSGVMVILYDESNFVASMGTDANGNYSFSVAGDQNYQVQIAPVSGFQFTTQNAGSDDTLDSDVDQPNGMTAFFFVASGAVNNTIDAGLFAPPPTPATIGNRVWNDLDRDGIQDAGEPGLADVTVELYDDMSGLLDSTTTDANGNYSFSAPGDQYYRVRFTLKSGYQFSPENVGDDSTDSDAYSDGFTDYFYVSAGGTNNTLDAGMYVPTPVVRFQLGTVFTNEGGGTATVYAVLDAPAAAVVTVQYATSDLSATAGSDYTATSGTLTFNIGEVSKPIPIALTDDATLEADETFRVTLSNPTNAVIGSPNPANVVILDNDGTDQFDNMGTEFWLTFMGNDNEDSFDPFSHALSLFISGPTATTGLVEIPGLSFSAPFTVTPGQVTTVPIPVTADLQELNDQVVNRGIHVTAGAEVAVYGLNYVSTVTDAFLALPTDILGTEYLIMSYPNSPLHPEVTGSEFALVGVHDDTEVTIVPKVTTGTRTAGVPYTITLDRGQTYQLVNWDWDGVSDTGDLTGTSISSDKPIAVFTGHQSAFVPTTYWAADHLVEQATPVETWGQRFVSVPLAMRTGGDTFRFVASEDNTEVTVNGAIVATLDRGEFHEMVLTDASEILGSHPILVAQFSNGSDFDETTGDPFMVLLPPVEQFLSQYTVTTPASGYAANFVNVVVPTVGVSGLRLDGEAITTTFNPVGTSGYSVAQVPLSLGSHRLSGTVPFGITMYGFDVYDSYGYTGGLALAPINGESISITAQAPDTRFPVGSTVLVTGKVTSTEPIVRVTVNGVPVEALDAAGNFFTRVTISAGDNVFTFEGMSISGLTADTALTLAGYTPDGVRFDSLTDTSASLKGEYARTSWDGSGTVLYADLAIRNTGTYKVGTPLLIGVRNLSHPLVDVRRPDGYAPDGTPFWDFSAAVADGTLDPNELTGFKTVAFDNPLRIPFTYDLVVLGQLNRAPVVSSLPVVRHHTGVDYTYDVDAYDPDGHPITGYTLAAGPEGMSIHPTTGVITWDELDVEVGTHVVRVEVRDDHGGVGTQVFILEATPLPPNRPPQFTSLPIVTAYINTLYSYPLSAIDPDGHTVTFALTSGPSGMTYDAPNKRLLWTPSGDQYGSVYTVVVTASDGFGGTAAQAFEVRLEPEPGNHTPQITTQPSGTAVTAGQTFRYDVDATDLDDDTLTYELLGNLPANMSINASTGEITWPVQTFSTPITLTIKVDDDRGGVATQPLVLTYAPAANAAISGTVFDDPDADGVRDAGEAAVAGATVFLDLNGNRRPDTAEPTTTSAADGLYQFTGLTPGSYRVVAVPPAGRVTTLPVAGLRVVGVAEGQTVSGIDFGTVVPTPAPTNRDPVMHNNPPLTATANQLWRHEILATDPDAGDILSYDAPLAPDGLTVDEATGLVAWTPTVEQVGTHNLVLRVRDNHDGVVWKAYEIVVGPANTLPVITSSPNTIAYQGSEYRYAVQAQDADAGDTLTYRLLGSLPTGLGISSTTGVITWANPSGAPTTIAVTVEVDDGHGVMVQQPYNLEVRVATPSEPPEITSEPRLELSINEEYFYQVTATDPDPEDTLSYELTQWVSGMEIDEHTGLLTWTAPATPGTANVTVRVFDGRGEEDTQTFTLTVSATPPVNNPPRVTSSPALVVRAGRLYEYDLKATDPDNDPVGFILREYPTGVSFNGNTGKLRWVPTPSQIGTHTFEVVAIDARGATSEPHIWTVTVSANRPPEVEGNPPTSAVEATTYFYPIRAIDPDGDPITFRVINGQQHGVQVDPDGLVHWDVPAGYAGQAIPVTLGISDGLVELSMSYTIQVTGVPTNHAPVILSSAPTRGVAGNEYRYQVVAQDPDPGDTLRYELRGSNIPSGMSINASTGLLTWNPAVAGTYTFWVAAVDRPVGQGGLAGLEQVVLVVRANTAPVVDPPAPPTSVTAGLPFLHDVEVHDNEGDAVRFSLTGPDGMTINEYGIVTWNQTNVAPGSYNWSVTVTDEYGAKTTVPYTVQVTPDDEAPVVAVRITPTPVANGSEVVIEVHAQDNIGVTRLKLTVNGQEVTLDAGFSARYAVNLPAGTTFPVYLPVLVEAWDAANLRGSAEANIEVFNPDLSGIPQVTITAPTTGTDVTAPTTVVGTVKDHDGGVVDYTVELFAETDTGRRRVRLLSTPNVPGTEYTRGAVTNGTLAPLDPTLLENGTYYVVVTARNGAGKTKQAETRVDVTGNLKLGNFHLDFTDMVLPVAGIPLTIGRSYDTLWAAEEGDFGYGWRLTFGDPNVAVTYPSLDGSGTDGLPLFRPGTRIVMTLSDGSRQGFTFEPIHEFSPIQGINRWRVFYRPDAGNTHLLTSADVDLVDYAHGDGRNGFEAIGLDGFLHSYHPGSDAFGGLYTLTDSRGLEYDIYGDPTDRDSYGKFAAARDRRGNELAFERAYAGGVVAVNHMRRDPTTGVLHPTGRGIEINRELGRIVSIVDPLGREVRYDYSPTGDLVSVTDRMAQTTTFSYKPNVPHYLDTVTDPLNRPLMRTTYDAENRLTALTDAAGNKVEFTINVAGRTVETKDQLGNPTLSEYDTQGRLLTQTDALDGVTTRTFDAQGRMTAQETPDGAVRLYGYNTQGRVSRETDPVGNVSEYTYDEYGSITASIDPLGNTTSYRYDDDGNITAVTNPDGVTVYKEYNEYGDLIAVSEPVRSFGPPASTPQARFAYDDVGLPTKYTDASGHDVLYGYDAIGQQTSVSQTVTTPVGVVTLNYTRDFDAEGRVTSTVDPEGGSQSFEYDPAGQLTAVTNPNGTRVEYGYDVVGNRTSMRDANGQLYTMTYDKAGRRLAATDPLNRTVENKYDELGRVVETILACGCPTKMEYDEVGRLTAQIDTQGHRVEFTYDAAGRETLVTDGAGGQKATTYDDAGRIVAVADAYGRQTTYQRDALGRVVSVTDADGNVTFSSYTDAGRLDYTEDALGHRTSYEYDELGRTVAVIDDSGRRVETEYDELGRAVGLTGVDGLTTEQEFDKLGRVTAVMLPTGIRLETTYDAVGNVIAHTDEYGDTVTSTYDNLGNLTEAEFDDGTTIARVYDSAGQLISSTDRGGRTSTFTYTANGQVKTVTGPDGKTTTNDYTSDGWLLSTTDPDGNTVSYTHDAVGRVLTVTDPRDGVTTYTYDNTGNLLTLTDPSNNTTTYEYDDLDRLTQETNQAGHSRTYEYDANSNLLRRVDRNGRAIEYTYDELDRQVSSKWLVGTTVVYEETTVYDTLGRVDSITDPFSMLEYTYDEFSRVETETAHGVGGAPVVVLTSGYDDEGRRTALGATVAGVADFSNAYGYDHLGRLTTLQQTGASVAPKRVEFDYNPANQITDVRRYADAAGTNLVVGTVKTYDTTGRVSAITHKNAAATTLAGYGFEYNARSLLSKITSVIDGVSTFAYDEAGQLTSATRPAGQPSENYAYDATGNRSGHSVATDNRVTSDGTYTYEYDNEGNRTKQTETATGEVTTYEYDHLNRLTKVTTKSAGGIVLSEAGYVYDMVGRRIEERLDADGAGSQPAAVARFAYDGADLILEFDAAGQVTHRYLYGPGADMVLADERPAVAGAGRVLWPLTDHQMSVRDVVNNAATVVEHVAYDSFGNVYADTNPGLAVRFGYTGREADSVTGLIFYRARWYDPVLGRFLSQDPAGFEAGDVNLYRYTGNDPINHNDPSGMFAVGVGGVGGLGLGVGHPEGTNMARLIAGRINPRTMPRAAPRPGVTGSGATNATLGFLGSAATMLSVFQLITDDLYGVYQRAAQTLRDYRMAVSAIGEIHEFYLARLAGALAEFEAGTLSGGPVASLSVNVADLGIQRFLAPQAEEGLMAATQVQVFQRMNTIARTRAQNDDEDWCDALQYLPGNNSEGGQQIALFDLVGTDMIALGTMARVTAKVDRVRFQTSGGRWTSYLPGRNRTTVAAQEFATRYGFPKNGHPRSNTGDVAGHVRAGQFGGVADMRLPGSPNIVPLDTRTNSNGGVKRVETLLDGLGAISAASPLCLVVIPIYVNTGAKWHRPKMLFYYGINKGTGRSIPITPVMNPVPPTHPGAGGFDVTL